MSAAGRSARGKRHVRRPPDLTSLFDVLFIVVFVALIRAAAAQQEVARLTPPPAPPTPPKPAPPAPPPDVVALRAKALANLERDLAARTPIIVRISAADDRHRGIITSLEHEGQAISLDVPLLADSHDPDVEVAYLGDRSAELRVCRIAAVHLRLPDLARHLVVLVPDRTNAELKRIAGSEALLAGLERDVMRCFIEQRGTAVLIDLAELAVPASLTPVAPTPTAPVPAAPSPP